MEEFENLQGFLEHIALVMDTDGGAGADAVSIMTLHAAKGLEFDTVFLPGWEEGLLPHQRSLDDEGRAGLEEERRLAHVGITRARRRARIYFATNRRIHGSWSTTAPSRFLDELPEAHVEVTESKGGFGWGGSGGSRFDELDSFASSYETPGWQRAQANRAAAHGAERGAAAPKRRGPMLIEGELVAKSTGTVSAFAIGDRIFHVKFGYGDVTSVEGNKLIVEFDKAGEKHVVDTFVDRA
jgi:DNA helicase-2/ATP-dependent DNA helicase PcrA